MHDVQYACLFAKKVINYSHHKSETFDCDEHIDDHLFLISFLSNWTMVYVSLLQCVDFHDSLRIIWNLDYWTASSMPEDFSDDQLCVFESGSMLLNSVQDQSINRI